MQALRDAMSQIQSRNAVVFGISADTVESHKQFAQKEHLNFPLLADPGKQTIAAYGALGKNGFADRYTFIIDADGYVQSIDRAVNSQFSREGGTLISKHGLNLALALSDWRARVGKPVPDFSLVATDGGTVQLYAPGKKAYVVIFVSKNCPVSRAYNGRLIKLAHDPAYADVAFLATNSNADEPMTQVRANAEENHFPYPVVKDANCAIAEHFGARATPTVWVIGADRVAAYNGAVDDNQDETKVTRHYLKDALDAVLSGRPVAVAETRAFGCVIRRAPKKKA